MSILHSTISVGASAPFQIIHISDTHLTLADDRDNERKRALAARRINHFKRAQQVLSEASALARELGAPIMHTGDLLDFVSVANIECAARFVAEQDCFLAAGNHEFSQYVGEAWEDAAYRNQSLDAVQRAFRNDIRMSSRVINGVNFVALDNGYYLFEQEQLDFLQGEVARGLPIVLMIHTPLYEPQFFEQLMYHRERKPPCSYLTAVPTALMADYDEKRRLQQQADELTYRTVAYIREQPLIRAVLTGHLHITCEAALREGVPQLMVSTEDIRVITVE